MAAQLDVVQPAVLIWARETAHLNRTDAARIVGVSEQRIETWEEGQRSPTFNQLVNLAKAYERPVGALFLPEPPKDEVVFDLPDFRRGEVRGQESPALRRAILATRDRLEAIDSLVDEGTELPFTTSDFSISLNEDVDRAAAKLREEFDLSRLSRTSRDAESMLSGLIALASSKGYLVMQTQRIEHAEMRGFSIKGRYASAVVLNGADFPRGKTFTLLHEIVHISLRSSALCDISRRESNDEERFCDAVTSAALMPEQSVLSAFSKHKIDPENYDDLRTFADLFGPAVSAETALLRLVTLQKVSWDTYNSQRRNFRKQYDDARRALKEKQAKSDAPIYYPVKVRDLGRDFIRVVAQAHDDGVLSARDTAALLDISYDNLRKLRNQATFGRTS